MVHGGALSGLLLYSFSHRQPIMGRQICVVVVEVVVVVVVVVVVELEVL